MGIFKRIFSRNAEPSVIVEAKKSIKDMTYPEIVALFSQGGTVNTTLLIDVTQRLIDIGLFDNHVPIEERKEALMMVEAVKKTIEQACVGKPDLLNTYRHAYEHQESGVEFSGIGSIAWLIREHNIPADHIVPFAVSVENGNKLANFIKVMGDEAYLIGRPEMVKQLIHSRRLSTHHNAVLILYGLASAFDPATMALFSSEEITTLLNTPNDYGKSRNILVDAGLLPATGHARPLTRPHADILNSLMLGTLGSNKEWLKGKEIADFLEQVPEDFSEVISVAVHALGIILISSMLGSLYGETVEQESKSAGIKIFSSTTKEVFEVLDNILNEITKLDAKIMDSVIQGTLKGSLNGHALLTTAVIMGVAPEDEEAFKGWYETQSKNFNIGNEVIANFRCECLSKLRWYIRYFNDRHPDGFGLQNGPDIDMTTMSELLHLYILRGPQAGFAEAATFSEDWIGT